MAFDWLFRHKPQPMTPDLYRAKKEELRALRDGASDRLQAYKDSLPDDLSLDQQRQYSRLVTEYTQARDRLKLFIETNSTLPRPPSREERRKAKLRRRGIKPVWD